MKIRLLPVAIVIPSFSELARRYGAQNRIEGDLGRRGVSRPPELLTVLFVLSPRAFVTGGQIRPVRAFAINLLPKKAKLPNRAGSI
ncbi:MAG: hypothetical protein ABSG03_39025 [Bryobacteraceae bacterium]